jgi:hypothetical protein
MKNQMPSLLLDNTKSLYNNPYYLFNNASVSKATYYNLNTTMTTLDESTRGNYAEISPESPLRYNKINGFCLYGVNKIEPALEISDFGLEGSDVQGDAIVLPKTIIPYPYDFFVLETLGEKYLFKVTSVNPNMLDTGATLYRINYSLNSTDGVEHIEPQVVKTYNFSIDNYGSNYGCLIEESTSSEVSEIERYTVMLKDYYIQLFYNARIQSFSYVRNGILNVYDPFLIEFLIRNNVLDGATNYIHLDQQVYLSNTFGIDYDRSFFSALEDKDSEKHECRHIGNLELCQQRLSLLYAYPQDYYVMRYDNIHPKFHLIDIFDDPAFMQKVRDNEQTDNVLKNIIIGYFNGESITSDILKQINHVDFMSNSELYYLIPFAIYCMEQYASDLLDNSTVTEDTTSTTT